MVNREIREGEVLARSDPASLAADAGLVFLGRIVTPWREPADCPKNPTEARARARGARILIDKPWRPGLAGLTPASDLIVLYWMDRARRDLIVQCPRHKTGPRGVFSLRSPLRPNPIALAVVKLLDLNPAAGRLEIDAIDCLDGTPLLDLKPYIPGIDEGSSGYEQG